MKAARRTHELLELSDLNLDGRSLDSQAYYAPTDVQLTRGHRLVWTPGILNWRLQRPQPGLLHGFLRLADAADAEIRQYASIHGVLQICRHGLPALHNPPPEFAPGVTVGRSWCRVPPWEDTERWRHFSTQANAALRIAAALTGNDDDGGARNRSRPTAPFVARRADWTVLEPYLVVRLSGTREITESGTLAFVLSQWLRWGGVGPVLSWIDRSRIELSLQTFFGALAMQLVLATSGSKGLAFCAECGRPYIPAIRIAESDTRDHFCETCRSMGVPQQRASRRHYANQHRGRKSAKEAQT